ncbi:MAG: TetR/AcrR family transcriptional regulator [Actinomycetota bacterium]
MPKRHRARRHGRGAPDRSDVGEDPRVARTRERVLAAGRELLDEEGPDAVTHLRIGDETGIARTTIYRHWPDRESLLAAVLTDTDGGDTEVDQGDLRSDLHAYFAALGRRTGGRRERHRMAHVMARAEHDRSFADVRRDRVERRLAPLRAILERAVDRGELPDGLDVTDAAVDLVAPVFFRRFFLGERVTDERIDALVDAFVERYDTG